MGRPPFNPVGSFVVIVADDRKGLCDEGAAPVGHEIGIGRSDAM